MNHQPFEEWLLADEPISPEQARALEEHLQDCPVCPPLAEAWDAVREDLESAPWAVPAPAFSQRWQATLARKKAQEGRRRWWLGGGAGVVALAGAFVLAIPLIGNLSPTEILVRAVYVLSLLVVKASQIGVLFGMTFQGFSVVIPVAAWIIVVTPLSILGLLWVFTMWKIIIPKGVKVL